MIKVLSIHTHYAQTGNPGLGFGAAVMYKGNALIHTETIAVGKPASGHVAALYAAGAGLKWLAAQTERQNETVWFFISLQSALNAMLAIQDGRETSYATPENVRERLEALLCECDERSLIIRFDWQSAAQNPATQPAGALLFERTGQRPKVWQKRA